MNPLSLPTIHPRHVPCELAKRELEAFVMDWRSRHNLTAAECLQLVVGAAYTDLQWLVRSERKEAE